MRLSRSTGGSLSLTIAVGFVLRLRLGSVMDSEGLRIGSQKAVVLHKHSGPLDQML